MSKRLYCLDTNAFIEPWNKYYSMVLCPDYWAFLDNLAINGIIFCPDEVKREIDKMDDTLKAWLSDRPHLIHPVTEDVQMHVRDILAKFPNLVQQSSNRSMADPWVIAHALAEKAIVVSKEFKTHPNQNRDKVKIPDVCREYKVRCINDIEFVSEIGIRFYIK